ncbi:AT-hook motif nuclear-localized protein 10-like [Phragmites australis]|uniref:AT-hook motif nuclear-localized protein 10-like n=1 Tax=Phragmites australis TaxID=29695 RepID=UPI002D7A15D4|nr:AT-hook motif nuclear-localized protein 10-like [Phragmites australis]XP_062191902.1 AT-hook motif nuclear-localized protein 10-like [Phragmites australis]
MEVRSEQGLMAGRDLFGMPKSPPAPAPAPGPPSSVAMQSVRMAYTADGTPVFAPVSSSALPPVYQPQGAVHGASMSVAVVAGGNGAAASAGMGEPVAKKKRGRPRKYGLDGSMSLALVPAATGSPAMTQGSSGPFSPEGLNPANPLTVVSPDGMKKRGRPKGSTNKPRIDAIRSSGVGFTPHVITVQAGEDVSAKIMSFSQHGTRAVCVLSANGAISNVTLRQTATSGGTVTYEGRFEILSLSGSFLLTENGGQHSRTGGLSVSLAGPDGRLLGGGVAGLLIAASPIQIVVGSFNADGKRERKQHAPSDPSSAPLKVAPTTGMGPNSPPSRGTLSESSGGAGSPRPLHQGMASCSNNQPPILSSMPWK